MKNEPFEHQEQLARLVAAHCDETITDEEFAQLEQLLQAHPEARAFYRRYLNLDASLSDFGRTETSGWSGQEQAKMVTPPQSQARSLWALAAGVVLLLALGIWWSQQQAPRVTAKNSAPAENQAKSVDPGVALLTQVVDVAWIDEPMVAGVSLPLGRLQFASGLMQIEFFSGAIVVLEGPADFELKSENHAVCRQGKLRATVPPEAVGFTIDAPTVKLVDLGTEFGMDVAEDGAAEVHVFDGKVELHSPEDQPQMGIERELLAGSAVRIPSSGQPEAIESMPDDFASNAQLEKKSVLASNKRYAAWRKVSERLKADPRIRHYYNFEDADSWARKLRSHLPKASKQDGAIVGCQWTEGRWPGKGALEFKRSGDRVRFTLRIPKEPAVHSLTLMTWVRVDSLDQRFNALMLTDGSAPGKPHWQITKKGALELGLRLSSRESTVYTSAPILRPGTLGRWVHLATVYDGTGRTVTHYLNGRQVSSHPLTSTIKLRGGQAQLGNWGRPHKTDKYPARKFNGLMDEFAIFSEALDESEIKKIHRVGRPQSARMTAKVNRKKTTD